jgi:hypothetical protein
MPYMPMSKRYVSVFALLALLVSGGWFLAERAIDTARGQDPPRVEGEGVAQGSGEHPVQVGEDVVFTPEDVQIHRATVDWALENRLDTLPIGEIIVRTGQRFVGDPYTPHTLELEGPERLVVNLREFDCVTFVESVLALSRAIRAGSREFSDFTEQLRRIRYRDGVLDGYASRLHYFSDWMADNVESGIVEDITAALDGVLDPEPIDFMSTHTDAYPSFAGRPDRVNRIQQVERALRDRPRYYVPEDQIQDAVPGIHNGDVIAATSTVPGLDIAHTGLAVWRGGRLHLMHAPLVGHQLEVSEEPLAARVQRIEGQDGIMVARPL